MAQLLLEPGSSVVTCSNDRYSAQGNRTITLYHTEPSLRYRGLQKHAGKGRDG
jgi:hypothetical protein